MGLIMLFALSGAGMGALLAALTGTRPLWWIIVVGLIGGTFGAFWAGLMKN